MAHLKKRKIGKAYRDWYMTECIFYVNDFVKLNKFYNVSCLERNSIANLMFFNTLLYDDLQHSLQKQTDIITEVYCALFYFPFIKNAPKTEIHDEPQVRRRAVRIVNTRFVNKHFCNSHKN